MKIIIGKKNNNKTKRMIKLAYKYKGILVCHPNQIDYIKNYALKKNLELIIISYLKYLNKSHSILKNTPVFIDNIDLFLESIDYRIKGFSVREEYVVHPKYPNKKWKMRVKQK